MKGMKGIILILMFLLALGMMACEKDKPTTGGGDNSVTMSGTLYSYTEYIYPDQYIGEKPLDNVTMIVTATEYINNTWTVKTLFGPTTVNSTFSVRFSVDKEYFSSDIKWSKSGCSDSGVSLTIKPGSKFDGKTSLQCG